MLRLASILIVAAGLSLPATAQTANALRVKPVQIMDTGGFGRPLPAMTLLVPHHWQTEGGVVWNPQDRCNGNGYNFSFKASSPDGAYGISVLPTASWQAHYGMPGANAACPTADLRSANDFLQWYVKQLLPDSQVLDFRQRADLLRGLDGLASRTPYGNGAYSEIAVDAGEVLIAFSHEGRDMRGLVTAVVIMWHSHFPGSPSMMEGVPGTPGIDIFGGSNLPAFGAFAPNGELDIRTAEMIRKSARQEPEWSRLIADHQATLHRQRMKGAADRHQTRMDALRAVGDIINKGYADRSASQDRAQREFVESIRGVETYDDPINGGTVQLDNTYRHAWQLNDGSYVLTDDEFFNPYAAFGQDGQRLSATR